MPTTLKGLDHVAFATDDFDRTRALCEDVLGLEPIPTLAVGYPGYQLAWYKDRDGTEYHVSRRIADLHEQLGSAFNQSRYSHVAFEVVSLDDAKAQLAANGFEYHELTREGIVTRRQLYVLVEESGLMLELFETVRPSD